MMLEPGTVIGPYTLVSRLGSGAFGVVWLAERRSTIATTQVALKIPLADEVDLGKVKEEAANWVRATGHPNIAPIFEAEFYDPYVAIASEYVSGGDLSSWLKKHGGNAPSPTAVGQLMDGILAGLAHLHDRLITHRDLKPANILLQGETPRIADFGLARIKFPDNRWSDVAGTPAYMAPEAFDGVRNDQTDLWSAGVILYELLLGHRPFEHSELGALRAAIRHEVHKPIPTTIPLSLKRIVERALQKEALDRYPSASAMRQDLRRAISGYGEAAQAVAVPAYFYPGQDWSDMLRGAPKVSLAIVNPNSGSGIEQDPRYVGVREDARLRGVQVLGYVHTRYGARPLDEVELDVDTYKRWYSVDGVFVDQVSTNKAKIPYYRQVISHVKARPGGFVVLNPGTFPDEEYAWLADVLCVFDGSHSDHVIRQLPEWVFGYPPEKFWHIVYDAPTVDTMKKSLAAAKQRNAGYVYITDGHLPNPFGSLPSYWLEELSEA